jgi:predicted nucleic acid-binding protein
LNVLVDSDILIEITQNRNQPILAQWFSLAASTAEVLYCPVSATELWVGARVTEQTVTAELFGLLRCAVTDYDIAKLAAEYLRTYKKSHSLELPDALIAATAVRQQALLWTRNRKHYPMPDLSFY